MRPTDVCHPNDLRAPASRAFPASSHDFHRVDTPPSLRLCAVIPGDQTVHAVWTASADCPSHNGALFAFPVCLVRSASRLSRHERGRFLPTARGSIEPLTSLSLLPVHHVAHVAFARAYFVRRPVGRTHEVIVMGKPPSLPSTPARDDRHFQQTRMPSLGKDPS